MSCKSDCKPYEKVIQLLPGPTGPTGPMGPDTVAPVTRALKVQLIDGELTPIIIEGFSFEEDVATPPGWPLAGTYTFYRAIVLDEPQFNLSELLNVSGTITHTDVMIQQQAAVAHYHLGVLQDIHWASSFIAEDAIDTLVTQTLHDVVVGDELYFGVTPSIASLAGFNYNISNVRCVPTFKIPEDLPLSLPDPAAGLLSGPFKALVTAPASVTLQLMSAGGGGGAGGSSKTDGASSVIGGGGGGGGSGGIFETAIGMSLALVTNDILEWQIGAGGAGGVGPDSDGKAGGDSQIKLNGTLLSGVTFAGPNPAPGGEGGKAGSLTAGGDGGASPAVGEGGGGGGAACVNGVVMGNGIGMDGGMDGGIVPRSGGDGGNGNPGGTGGGSLGIMGSGGGGGGAFILGGGGVGGAGGDEEGVFGFPGGNASLVNGGGGGGSGGTADPNESVPGGRGGIGGCGSVRIELA